MVDFKESLEKEAKLFRETDTIYRNKAEVFQNWKNQFRQLKQEVQQLIAFFEKEYEACTIQDGLEDHVRGQLENRREGIRLSVKSASRLLRRLNPEKPLENHTDAYITSEKLNVKLIHFFEYHDMRRKLQEQSAEVVFEPNIEKSEDQKRENVLLNEENIAEQAIESIPAQSSKQQEEQADFEEKRKRQEEYMMLIHKVIENNQEMLQQMDEDNRAAEKRFITFIDKGVAPVLDGLYSGEKYGKDLVHELTVTGSENIAQVEEWLNIYSKLMDEVKKFLGKFSVGLFSSEIGDLFDEAKHEPIGVVEDQNFGDEQIKEVVRYGLTFENRLFVDNPYLIRPAQVIVVKNKKQETIDEQRGNNDEI